MSTLTSGKWDFNEWMNLASSDPEAFEARRQQVVHELIEESPRERRQRLRCLQWRIDQVRQRSSTPMAGCISLYGMMWESLLGDGGLAEALNQAAGASPPRPRKSAHIVPLALPSSRN